MDPIIRVTSRILFPAIMIFGIYVAVYGHLSPGGAFPAGVILASGFAILLLTHKREDPEYDLLKLFSVKGIGIFMLILFTMHTISHLINSDILRTQTFLQFWSGGHTMFMNIVSMFLIFTAFSLILYSMVKK